MRSANPTLGVFSRPQSWDDATPTSRAHVMTMSGTIFASSVLIAITAAVGVASWGWLQTSPGMLTPALWGSIIGTLILGMVIFMKPRSAPFLAPIFAVGEGIFVGAFSLMVASILAAKLGDKVGGIGVQTVFQAMGLTFGIFAAMLIGYASGLLKFGSVVKNCIYAATGGLFLFTIVAFVLMMFGMPGMASVFSVTNASPISIGFSLFVVVLASLSLVLDFEMIETGVANKAPKYMEWYAGFSLLVTLVWLYVEVLRLLAKLNSRD